MCFTCQGLEQLSSFDEEIFNYTKSKYFYVASCSHISGDIRNNFL